jgi:hypothetical protein
VGYCAGGRDWSSGANVLPTPSFLLTGTCGVCHIYVMPRPKELSADVERWFREELGRLWPVALGSLSLRRSPCIRKRCRACETGEQHSSYVLYGRQAERRFAIYVPDSLVPRVRRALESGRALQALLYEAGRRYVEALKRERIEGR